MQRFINAGRQSIEESNWYSALVLALTLPDICASLEGHPRGAVRYKNWCKKWLEPHYTEERSGQKTIWLSANDCYLLRCSLLHAGSDDLETPQDLSKVVFCDPSIGPDCNKIDGVLQLRVDYFCQRMFSAVNAWDESVINNSEIQARKSTLLFVRSIEVVIGNVRIG